jgi:hypothetical protein
MKKALTKQTKQVYYFVDGEKVFGCPPNLIGDVTDCEITQKDREKGVNISDLIL